MNVFLKTFQSKPLLSYSVAICLSLAKFDDHSVLLKRGKEGGRNEAIYGVYILGGIDESCVWLPMKLMSSWNQYLILLKIEQYFGSSRLNKAMQLAN